MEQEFYIKKGWKIFGYVFCVAILIVMLYFLVDAILSGSNLLLWIGLNIGSILLFGYCLVAIYRSKIVLTLDSIIEYQAFKEKQLLFSEVKGYRIRGVKIVLEPNDSSKSKMVVGDFSYTVNGPALEEFLTNKFKNLDDVDYETELTEVLHDPTVGTDSESREQRLTSAKKGSRILNAGGLIITFWLFIHPHPYLFALSVGLLYPIIAMIYFFRQQEVLTLMSAEKKSAYPSLNSALILPPTALIVRALIQYDLLSFKDCILPIILSSAAFTLIFLLFLRASKTRSNNFWMGVFFSLIYSSSGIVIVNCAFDASKPIEYKTRVLDQSITTGKSTTYYLKLDAWGPRKESEDESVPKSVYYSVKKGDLVTVYVEKGYLNIPWYYVQQ